MKLYYNCPLAFKKLECFLKGTREIFCDNDVSWEDFLWLAHIQLKLYFRNTLSLSNNQIPKLFSIIRK